MAGCRGLSGTSEPFELESKIKTTRRPAEMRRLANNSAEYLSYEIEHMTVTIESRTVGNPQFANRGVIIAPGRYDVFRFPAIRNVNANWRKVLWILLFVMVTRHPGCNFGSRRG